MDLDIFARDLAKGFLEYNKHFRIGELIRKHPRENHAAAIDALDDFCKANIFEMEKAMPESLEALGKLLVKFDFTLEQIAEVLGTFIAPNSES